MQSYGDIYIMNKITYRKISDTERQQVDNLIEVVLNELERKEFFIPFSKEENQRFFDENFGLTLGVFDGNKLVGMAKIYINQCELSSYKHELQIADKNVCELGDYLVMKEYRGHGIMKTLQSKLIELAKQLEYDVVIATVHPENIASIRVLSKHLSIAKTITTKNGYLRYLMKLILSCTPKAATSF